MSPREKHVPQDATNTTVAFTPVDRAAVYWISQARRARKDRRTTMNDVMIDALWHYVETVEGKTRSELQAMTPTAPLAMTKPSNVAQMPKLKAGR